MPRRWACWTRRSRPWTTGSWDSGPSASRGVRTYLAARAEQITKGVSYFRTLSVCGDAVAGLLDARGVDEYGTAILYEMDWVSWFVAGKIRWTSSYDPEDHAAAQARFEELGAETRTPYIDTACVRALIRAEWLVQLGDLSAAVDTIADEIVSVDRRKGVAAFASSAATTTSRIRSRSDACSRTSATSGLRREVSVWRSRSRRGHRRAGTRSFTTRPSRSTPLAASAATTSTTRSPPRTTHSKPATSRSKGLTSHPVRDQMQGMAELVPDFFVVLAKILTEGRAALVVGTTLGTTAEGSEYRWDFLQVFLAAADGRRLRRELFAEEQWPDALARFDELAADDDQEEP